MLSVDKHMVLIFFLYFYGMSTFVVLFNTKTILEKERQWHYLTYILGDEVLTDF